MRDIITILFNKFETLDVFSPIEIFGRLKNNFNPQFYSQNGGLTISTQNVPIMTKAISEINFNNYILFIPGGEGTRTLFTDKVFIESMKSLGKNAEFIFTVCTGSILFSKTGLLNGRKATSNKRVFPLTSKESPEVDWIKKARWVKDGNIYTSSGISAGIDMALGFISDLLGYTIAKQQSNEIEYDWKEDPDCDPFFRIFRIKKRRVYMTKEIFLLLNLVLAFYNVGTIWAMEIDIFRNWKVLDSKNFKAVQDIHWKKLSYWIFIPLGLSLLGAITLFWFHPSKIPDWEIWLPLGVQLISHILTALFWGQWQYKLSKDESGGKSIYLSKILRTHWIRTALWNANGLAYLQAI